MGSQSTLTSGRSHTDLSDKNPAWAAEFCIHHMARQIGRARAAGETNPFSSELPLLPHSQYGPQVLLASTGASETLAVGLVPLVLGLSRDNLAADGYHDTVWPYRIEGPLFGIGYAVRGAAEQAMRTWAATPSSGLEPLLTEIRTVHSATADHLLLAAYSGAVPGMADDAIAALLADDRRRLDLPNEAGATIANASPHCSESLLHQLEQSVLAYRSRHERDNPIPGRWAESQFQLLRAFARDRLSEAGRRRLEELERKFLPTTEPVEAARISGGFIQPPIPPEAPRHMGDEDWLRAMSKHQGPRPFHLAAVDVGLRHRSSVERRRCGVGSALPCAVQGRPEAIRERGGATAGRAAPLRAAGRD